MYCNVVDGVFYHIDPLIVNTIYNANVFKHWLAFCKTRVGLKDIKWRLVNDLEYTKQTDSYNCGVLISIYLINLLNGDLPFSFNPNPDSFRQEMLSILLNSD